MRHLGFRLCVLLMLCGACAGSYDDQRARSPHFVDGKFQNPVQSDKNWWSFFAMRLRTRYADWPQWRDEPAASPPFERVEGPDVLVTHINHSTVLLQTQGLNILTDPIWSERCSPVSFAGPKRVRAPGIPFEQLPTIDIVLISHDHYDHLDLPTLNRLIARDDPHIVAGLGVGRHVRARHKLRELDWWQAVEFAPDLVVHFVPVQHFSGRYMIDVNSTLWGGFVIELAERSIYFGGDSGYGPHYQQTFERYGPMDLAILPIGAYAPRDFMSYAHMDPAQAVQAHLDLHAGRSLGIHYGTFQLTAEPIDEPLEELRRALQEQGVDPYDFQTLLFGYSMLLP